MDWTALLTITIPTLTTAIVGVILKKQIKSQKDTISRLQNYIQTVSWEKVRDFYENIHIPAERLKTKQELFLEYGFTPEENKKLINDYNELISYFHAVLSNTKKAFPNLHLKDKILTGLPKNAKYFRDIWEDDKQQNPDIENNYQD
ncbi:MAG: hypothetical protein H3C36_00845 [Chitinophagaceae bacterium]|nr:hypothetical protein [Chitinophagaceae bacterium]